MIYDHVVLESTSIKTRSDRRKAAELLSSEIAKILYEEQEDQSRIPVNLQQSVRFRESDLSVDLLYDAYFALSDAFY